MSRRSPFIQISPLRGLLKTGDEAEEGGFAGAALAEQGNEFAGGDVERNTLQDFMRAEALGDGANFE